MQKKLIALAVAGLVSAPAFAQSNVTIYGVADAGFAFGEHGENDVTGIESGLLSGSRIGFRGTEALGNGLNAVFTLEQGFNIDNGAESDSSKAFQRQAFVGVAGGFGAVTVGRQYAPGYDFQYDAVVSAQFSPQAILSGAPYAGSVDLDGEVASVKGLTINPGSMARWDNSVAYNGSFAGLKVRAIYSFNAVETNTFSALDLGTGVGADRVNKPADDDAMGLGLEYANGPLKVGAVYHYLKDAADVSGLTDDQQEWLVGGSYNFGVLTLAGSYQQAKSANFIDNLDADLWQVGVIVPVGAAGNVHVAYGEVEYDADGEEADASSWTLAYTHALSKRTTAYVGYNQTDNDDGLSLGRAPAATAVATFEGERLGTVAETGEKSKLFVVGVRHTF